MRSWPSAWKHFRCHLLHILGSFLGSFSVLGGNMGALWGHFLGQTATWRAKGASRGACPEIPSRFWTRLGSQNRQKTIKNRCQDAFKFCIGFRIDFGSISDPKSTSKSLQNQSKNSSKINLQTSPISASSSIKFRRESHVQAKWSMFKNRSKT